MAIGITLTMALSTAAYLDPSLMTYAIQVIAGIAITCGTAFIIYWKRIKLLFKKKHKRPIPKTNAKE
jgi:hypothetical protein